MITDLLIPIEDFGLFRDAMDECGIPFRSVPESDYEVAVNLFMGPNPTPTMLGIRDQAIAIFKTVQVCRKALQKA